MKTRYLRHLLAAGAVIALVTACATTPKPQEAPAAAPAAAPAEQPAPAAAPVADPSAERDKALALQKQVTDFDLASYDADTYNAGTTDLAAGQATYGKDNASSKASFLKAADEFQAVIAKAVPQALAPDQKAADTSRGNADALKAAVAVKDAYAAADAVYQSAARERDALDIASARRDFAAAAAQFDAVTATAQQKKSAAEQALQDAQQAQSSSQAQADDAAKSLQDDNIQMPASPAQGG
jgi:hypothetical protein